MLALVLEKRHKGTNLDPYLVLHQRCRLIRLSKMTDYSVVVLAELAGPEVRLRTASDIASVVSIPEPTVSKVLKLMAKADILASSRGVKGGYALSRPATEILISQIIEAVEGPIALTSCVTARSLDKCSMENICSLSGRWAPLNKAVKNALQSVTLHDIVGGRAKPKEARAS